MKNKSHILHRIAAHYIKGEDLGISIKGSNVQVSCFKSLLEVSRKLKIELDKTNGNLNEVTNFINKKKKLTKEFQDLTGIRWHL
jgi:hypothetical protein